MKNVTDFSLKSDTFPVFVHILLTNLFGCDRIANGKNKKGKGACKLIACVLSSFFYA